MIDFIMGAIVWAISWLIYWLQWLLDNLFCMLLGLIYEAADTLLPDVAFDDVSVLFSYIGAAADYVPISALVFGFSGYALAKAAIFTVHILIKIARG